MHYCVCTETLHPTAALSQRVSMARILRQTVPTKYGIPLLWTWAQGLPIGQAKTFLELQYSLQLPIQASFFSPSQTSDLGHDLTAIPMSSGPLFFFFIVISPHKSKPSTFLPSYTTSQRT